MARRHGCATCYLKSSRPTPQSRRHARRAGGSFDDTSRPGNVTLNYTVRSVDRAGNVSVESPAYTMYRDTIPPTPPGGFSATSVTINSVALAWSASTDEFGIARYEITRTPGTTMSTVGPVTTYVDQTVESGTTYTYQVVAVDNHSVRSAPATISVTTPPGAPSVPVHRHRSGTTAPHPLAESHRP